MLLSQGFTSYSIRKNIVCVTYDEIHHDEFNDNRFLESIEGAFAKGNNSIQIIFGKTKKKYSKSPQCTVCESELPKKKTNRFFHIIIQLELVQNVTALEKQYQSII